MKFGTCEASLNSFSQHTYVDCRVYVRLNVTYPGVLTDGSLKSLTSKETDLALLCPSLELATYWPLLEVPLIRPKILDPNPLILFSLADDPNRPFENPNGTFDDTDTAYHQVDISNNYNARSITNYLGRRLASSRCPH
jgi:hypothetical protein